MPAQISIDLIFELALTTALEEKRSPSLFVGNNRVKSTTPGSENAWKVDSAQVCRVVGERYKTTTSATKPPTFKRMKFRAKVLKNGTFARSVPRNRTVGYDSSRYLSKLYVLGPFKEIGRLPPALWDDEFKCHSSFLSCFLYSTFLREADQKHMCITVREAEILGKMVCFRRAYHHAEECMMDDPDETCF